MTAWLTAVPLTLLPLLAASTAGGEQERVDGMGRTRGWVVATDGGDLGFVDCHGQRSPLGSARIEPSTGRCRTPRAPLQVTGVVRRVDAVRRILYTEDDMGRLRAFHIPTEVPRLEELKPGERIQATGPVDGQITAIARQ
jgi:hypothetical protein